MGLNFSAFGLPRLTSVTTKQVYDKHFMNIGNFEEFHIAYVEFCKYFNTIMPGQDFKTPSRKEIEEFYEEWKKESSNERKKSSFRQFIEKYVKEGKVDASLFIAAGLAVPVAAVVGKRASGNIPYVKNLRLDLVPNVVFVPVITLLGIIGATAWQISSKSAEEDKKDEKGPAEQVKQKDEKGPAEQNKKN